MFTGLVEEVARVSEVVDLRDGRKLTFEAPGISKELAVGDSVSVDGACLTVVHTTREGFSVEAIGTTLSRTIVGGYAKGSMVNLERALRMGDRLGGHLVQGHVDGLGQLLRLENRGEYRLMDFRIPAEVAEITILHGSVTLNGVSLTVNDLPDEQSCQVAIIPHTWAHTNLPFLSAGDPVNVEGDLIGKYLGKILSIRGQSSTEEAAPGKEDREP